MTSPAVASASHPPPENNNTQQRTLGSYLQVHQRLQTLRGLWNGIISDMDKADGEAVLPFCCCSRDWLSAVWGAMAGGGGSAGWLCWLCWLGRARVVPTAAAEEHTVQNNHRPVQIYLCIFHLTLLVSLHDEWCFREKNRRQQCSFGSDGHSSSFCVYNLNLNQQCWGRNCVLQVLDQNLVACPPSGQDMIKTLPHLPEEEVGELSVKHTSILPWSTLRLRYCCNPSGLKQKHKKIQ